MKGFSILQRGMKQRLSPRGDVLGGGGGGSGCWRYLPSAPRGRKGMPAVILCWTSEWGVLLELAGALVLSVKYCLATQISKALEE